MVHYLNFLEQSGITIVAEYAGRVYVRKNKANGPLELYTDSNEINKQVRKKFSMFISIGVSQFAFGIMLLISMLKHDPKIAVIQNGAFFSLIYFNIEISNIIPKQIVKLQ